MKFPFFALCLIFLAVGKISGDELKFSSVKEILLKEMKADELNLEESLANEFDSAAPEVSQQKSIESTKKADLKSQTTVLGPLSQFVTMINGEVCHVGNYQASSIVTVLEGPHMGLQMFITYQGVIYSKNTEYTIEDTEDGIYFRHEYPDSTVITGKDQVIILK